jgi:hypothetical protein
MLSLRSVGKKTNTAKRLLINKRQRLAPYVGALRSVENRITNVRKQMKPN